LRNLRCTCRISARPGFKRVVAIAPLRAYGVSDQQDRNRNGRRMTGSQSRSLNVGDRVYWRDDKNDLGTVTEKDWAGVTVKWDNRSQQAVLHNDMASVGVVSRK
jgi:FKBP-type peptidyl-prolyl cis-trans isomerase 2